MEMFGPVQWMALSWGWSPTLLPCCRAPSPALITMLYGFSVWYSPCWLSLCATCSQYTREMNARLMSVCQTRNTNGHAAYPFVSACVLFRLSVISLWTIDASCDLLCAHLHLPVRCLLLPFPPHIIPLLLIFAPWREKKVRYENKIQPALRVDFIATANSSCVVTVRDSRCNWLSLQSTNQLSAAFQICIADSYPMF